MKNDNGRRHDGRQLDAKASAIATRIGDAVFYLGFVSGAGFAGWLLYLEMKDFRRSLFDALAADSAVTFSLIGAFMIPLSAGWVLRYLISGRRWR